MDDEMDAGAGKRERQELEEAMKAKDEKPISDLSIGRLVLPDELQACPVLLRGLRIYAIATDEAIVIMPNCGEIIWWNYPVVSAFLKEAKEFHQEQLTKSKTDPAVEAEKIAESD